MTRTDEPASSGDVSRRPSLYQRIYSIVRLVPAGQVSTYGDVAALAGCGPRQVGYAMAAVPDGSGVPWHRIVNAQGRISIRSDGAQDSRQRALLAAEGIVFDRRGRLDLDRCRWSGPDPVELASLGIDSPLA